jgi:hypothetical protein
MTLKKKIPILFLVAMLLIASFFLGSYVREQRYNRDRVQRCCTLISFAINKAENENLADMGTMSALISNVYAAYQFCDDSSAAPQLHDLWNFMLRESNKSSDVKDIVLNELNAVLNSIKPAD